MAPQIIQAVPMQPRALDVTGSQPEEILLESLSDLVVMTYLF